MWSVLIVCKKFLEIMNTSSAAPGNIYGDNLIHAIKEFQRRTGLVADGCTGELTLAMLKKYGFSE